MIKKKKMTKYELIRAWYKALKTTRKRQGVGALKQLNLTNGKNEYCCLGILCEVAGLRGVDTNELGLVSVYAFDGRTDTLPDSLAKVIGNNNPLLRVPKELLNEIGEDPDDEEVYGPFFYLAANLNDEEGFTFKQIADCVKATWPRAFKS